MHDKELGACAVRHHASCHGKHACGMLKVIFKAVIGKFSFDAVSGAAHTGAGRISALDHETRDDPVEDDAVIKALIDKAYKVIDRIGSYLGIKLCGDDAAIFHLYGYDGVFIFHDNILPFIFDKIKRCLQIMIDAYKRLILQVFSLQSCIIITALYNYIIKKLSDKPAIFKSCFCLKPRKYAIIYISIISKEDPYE